MPSPDPDRIPPDAPQSAPPERASAAPDRIGALVQAIRALDMAQDRGALARLRRLDLDRLDALSIFAVLARAAPEVSRPETVRRYAAVLQAFAFCPDRLAPDRSLGETMATEDVSESRVMRLLNAEGDGLLDQARLLARRLARSDSLPARDLARLLLDGDDPDRGPEIRLKIARDYWRTKDRKAAAEDRASDTASEAAA